MYIIDLHTHIYPENIAVKATESVKDFYDLGIDGMDGTSAMLLERGKRAGISKFVVLPVAIKPDRVRSINNFILRKAADHEEFIGFGTIHAGMENIADEAEWIANRGLKGIKMHPDSQRFAIDDPRLFPAFEAIQGRIPVMLHTGDVRYPFSHPARVRTITRLFPKLEIVAAHFGGYSMYETAYKELNGLDNVIMDISSSLMLMPEGVAEKYIRLYGAERMAYGTDYPMWDPEMEVPRFLKLKLTDEEFEQIAHKTTERFLRLK